MRTILITSALLMIGIAYSQGYENKKYSIAYQPAYSFCLNSYIGRLTFLFHNGIEFRYAPSARISLGLGASYLKKVNSDVHYQSVVEDQTIHLSLNYHRKIKHSIAPGGKYMGLKLDVGKESTFRDIDYSDDTQSYTKTIYDNEIKQTLIMVSANFGRNFVIKNKYLFGYGIQWGVPVSKNQPYRHFSKPYFNLGILL